MVPRLRECCRQSHAEVVSNSKKKIHHTWGPPFSRTLSRPSGQNILTDSRKRKPNSTVLQRSSWLFDVFIRVRYLWLVNQSLTGKIFWMVDQSKPSWSVKEIWDDIPIFIIFKEIYEDFMMRIVYKKLKQFASCVWNNYLYALWWL